MPIPYTAKISSKSSNLLVINPPSKNNLPHFRCKFTYTIAIFATKNKITPPWPPLKKLSNQRVDEINTRFSSRISQFSRRNTRTFHSITKVSRKTPPIIQKESKVFWRCQPVLHGFKSIFQRWSKIIQRFQVIIKRKNQKNAVKRFAFQDLLRNAKRRKVFFACFRCKIYDLLPLVHQLGAANSEVPEENYVLLLINWRLLGNIHE